MEVIFSIFLWLFIFFLIPEGKSNVPYGIRGGGGGGSSTTSHTYYYYKIKFAHTNIDASQPIIFYNTFGTILYSLPPYYSNMNYGEGILSVPGSEQNTTIEQVSTATYYVFYSTNDLVIDYEKAEFKIAKNIISVPANAVIKATFEYLNIITPFKDIASVIDGKWDTQVQTEFFGEPPAGFNYAIMDLGSVRNIQAVDLVAGFYKPDLNRKFDINFSFSLQSSTDGVDYYDISDGTKDIELSGGSSKSLEESDLGVGFEARYLKVVLSDVGRIEYSDKGRYVVAFTEITAYDDIILQSEAKLIPMNSLTEAIVLSSLSSGSFPTTVTVQSTASFASSGSAYIQNSDNSWDYFTYTGKTDTSFTGVLGISNDHDYGDSVVQELEGDTTLYDYTSLLPKLKDRVYKLNKIDENMLFSKSQVDYVSKEYLKEFVKEHTKIQVSVMYSPHIEVGQTLLVTDTYNNVNNRYFVDSIEDSNGFYTLTLARFPSS
jgi:hypothetical protein